MKHFIFKSLATALLVLATTSASAVELKGGRRAQFSDGEQCGVVSLVQDQETEKFHALSKESIAVFTFFPSELSTVGGVITLEEQPKFSHISLKVKDWAGRGWVIPNADISKDECIVANSENLAEAFTTCFDGLKDGDYAYVKSTKRGRLLKVEKVERGDSRCPGALEEQEGIKIVSDLTFTGLPDHAELNWKDHNKVGSKAANYAQLMNTMNSLTGEEIVRPGFAIPFYYYNQFLTENANVKEMIESILTDEKLNTDSEALYRGERLQALQDLILSDAVSVDAELLKAVLRKTETYKDLDGLSRKMKFRSSTNAEDLPNFSGAGLYTSKSYKPLKKGKERSEAKKLEKLEESIKVVWASIWNKRAYDERVLYGIDHRKVFMGIQVNLSFPDEIASGVVVSANPDDVSDQGAVFVEAQRGDEYSVENPVEGVLAEQLLLTPALEGPVTIERLRYSTVAEDAVTILPTASDVPVLTDQDAGRIFVYATLAEDAFRDHLGVEGKPFALDIEFKVDRDLQGNRRVYFKQARPYLIH